MRRINVSAAIGAPRLSRWRCDKKKNILYGKKKKKNPFSYVIYKRRAIRNNNNIKKDISTRSVLCVCVSLLALNKARCAPLPSCLMGPWSFSLYRPAHTERERERERENPEWLEQYRHQSRQSHAPSHTHTHRFSRECRNLKKKKKDSDQSNADLGVALWYPANKKIILNSIRVFSVYCVNWQVK